MKIPIKAFLFQCSLVSFCFGPLLPLDATHFHNKTSVQKTCSRESIDLTVMGSVNNCDGLGKQAIDLMLTLNGKVSMSYLPSGSVIRDEIGELPLSIQKILQTSGKSLPGKVLIQTDMLAGPSNYVSRGGYWHPFGIPEKTNDQIRFAYTMFEASKVPDNWVYILNHSFDAAIVPDRFLIDVYKNSGVTIPVFYIALGRDFSRFLETPLKSSRNTPFVFANFSACIARKNLVTLVRAFANAFGNSPKILLRLGWRGGDVSSLNGLYDAINDCQLTNIKIDDYPLSVDNYLKRFQGIDCYVSLSTGEGFSIQPREALCLGIPTIVTKNTGQTTICSSGVVRVVQSIIEIPACFTFPGQFGVQYQCQQQDVVDALLDVYNNYDSYLNKAPKARKWAQQYHYPNMAPLYEALVKPKKVIHGKFDKILEDGGIMTTSDALVKKYHQLNLG